MKTRKMTEGRPLKLILALAVPLMIGNVFQQLYTVVDASVVGKGLGVAALAALGASDWFNWMCLSLAQGFAQGFTIPMAQAFGANDPKELRRTVGSAVVLSAVLAILFTVAAELLINPVLSMLGTPLDIRPMSREYLRVYFAGIPIVMAYNLMAGILRALGDGRSPLIAMIIASIVNIVLDVLFVLGLGWGVASAAAATVIAQVCSAVYCLYCLNKLPILHLERGDLKLEKERCMRLLGIGLPISLQNAIIAVGGMIVQMVVNPMGVTFIAGYTATNKLYGLLEMAAISYGYAMQTYAGQNLGAGKIRRISKGVGTGLRLGTVTSCLIMAAMLLFGKGILGLFMDAAESNAAEALEVAFEYLTVMSVCLPILYVLHVVRSTLQGMGDTVMPMVSGAVEFVMRTGSALLLPALVGYRGVFYAEVLAWLGAVVVLVGSYLLKIRKLKATLVEE